jgi:hypothetical protein
VALDQGLEARKGNRHELQPNHSVRKRKMHRVLL